MVSTIANNVSFGNRVASAIGLRLFSSSEKPDFKRAQALRLLGTILGGSAVANLGYKTYKSELSSVKDWLSGIGFAVLSISSYIAGFIGLNKAEGTEAVKTDLAPEKSVEIANKILENIKTGGKFPFLESRKFQVDESELSTSDFVTGETGLEIYYGQSFHYIKTIDKISKGYTVKIDERSYGLMIALDPREKRSSMDIKGIRRTVILYSLDGDEPIEVAAWTHQNFSELMEKGINTGQRIPSVAKLVLSPTGTDSK